MKDIMYKIEIQLDPVNLDFIISNSQLFRTQNTFPLDIPFTHLLFRGTIVGFPRVFRIIIPGIAYFSGCCRKFPSRISLQF